MLIQLALRNVKRNYRRSGLTIATVILGCALLTIALSWLTGLQSGMLNAAVKQSGLLRLCTDAWHQRDSLLPLEENLPVTDAVVDKIIATEGVTAVYPKISMGVAASQDGNEVGTNHFVTCGVICIWYL